MFSMLNMAVFQANRNIEKSQGKSEMIIPVKEVICTSQRPEIVTF